jgi:hypothetical protein
MLKCRSTDRWFDLPGDQSGSNGLFGDDFLNISSFVLLSFDQKTIRHQQWRQTLIDDPRIRFNFSTAQISLQLSGFMDGRCFGQCYDQHASKLRISQPWQQVLHGFRHRRRLSSDLAMICQSRIQQQNGMTRRRRIEHDETIGTFRVR